MTECFTILDKIIKTFNGKMIHGNYTSKGIEALVKINTIKYKITLIPDRDEKVIDKKSDRQ